MGKSLEDRASELMGKAALLKVLGRAGEAEELKQRAKELEERAEKKRLAYLKKIVKKSMANK